MYIFCFVVPTVAYRKRPSFVIILFVTCSVFITFVVMGSIKGPVFIFLFLNLLTPELSSLSVSLSFSRSTDSHYGSSYFESQFRTFVHGL